MAIKGSAALLVVSAIVYALSCAWAELIPENATAAFFLIGACNYSKWQQVGKCSVTCGQGYADFESSPVDPSPADPDAESAESCSPLKSRRPCDAGKCPVHCNGQWSSWDTCRPNCTKVRHYQIILRHALTRELWSRQHAPMGVAQSTVRWDPGVPLKDAHVLVEVVNRCPAGRS